MTDVPSRQTVAVQFGPTEGHTPMVCIAQGKSEELPPNLRHELCEHLAYHLQRMAEVIEDTPYHGKKHPRTFAIIKFAPGVRAHEALKTVRRVVAWFFENLAPSAHRRTARYMKKLHKKEQKERRSTGRAHCRERKFAFAR